MKKSVLLLSLAVIAAVGGVAYAGRQRLAQFAVEATRPAIPPAQTAEQVASSTVDGRPSSVASAPNTNRQIPAPKDINLAVPFLLQSPFQDWVQPYEDGCEEASAAMVHGYYAKKTYPTPEIADAELQTLFAWEDRNFGTNKDADAGQVARMLREHYGYKKVVVTYDFTAEDLRAQIRAGRPVIIPAYGKALGNPNFKNGGPVYHMLVVKGYIGTDTFITNDSGTRKGAEYVYAAKVLMAAAHDWNGGDVPNGKKAMIVAYPNAK